MELTWFVFALTSTLIWSVGAIVLKFVRINYIKSPAGYLVITAPAALFGFVFLLFGEFHLPSLKAISYILITTVTALVGYWLYLTAIHKEEISRVTTLQGIGPLVMLILATIFLKEVLTIKDYLAFPLIIIGGMLISVKKVEERFRLSPGLVLILISIFFFSIQGLFFKLVADVNFATMIVIRQTGFLVIMPLFFIFSKKIRGKVKENLKQLNKRKLALMYIAEFIGMTGLVFSYLAIQRGPVSLVALVGGTQCLFVIILATFISFFMPHILKEKIDKKTIGLKITSALLMIAGLALIVV